ncbi:hypothetical protein [Hyalangium gracile]|uniref:hypothetical protein n=1 Tax=Hyalangium gracile TaxID=394092 RepID=UPI001CD016F5|nr:hypothetical protein [Hyalangium gracile]
MARGAAILPLLALLSLSCAPDASTAVIIQSRTEGLNLGGKAIAEARVGIVRAEGVSAFFTSGVLSSSTITVHTSGRLWVARGEVQVTFTNRDGIIQTVRATPGTPGEWKADIRTMKTRDGTGFSLLFQPLGGTPPQADGVLLEVSYEAG